jgi:flagellar motility protein MotE (MotC chaperone)
MTTSEHHRSSLSRVAWCRAVVWVFVLVLFCAAPVTASEDSKGDKDRQAADSLPLPPVTPQQLSPAEQYCTSVVDATAAAQIAQQTSNLEKASKELAGRVALLDAKTAELKSWVKKREDFTAKATTALLDIYSKMKPDAAAHQLTEMNELTTAAIIAKLSPKVSSLILAEMDTAKASRITGIIAGASEVAAKLESMADAQHK